MRLVSFFCISHRLLHVDSDSGWFYAGGCGLEYQRAGSLAAAGYGCGRAAKQFHLGILERQHACGVAVGCGLESAGSRY